MPGTRALNTSPADHTPGRFADVHPPTAGRRTGAEGPGGTGPTAPPARPRGCEPGRTARADGVARPARPDLGCAVIVDGAVPAAFAADPASGPRGDEQRGDRARRRCRPAGVAAGRSPARGRVGRLLSR